jgi:hypothetical protein
MANKDIKYLNKDFASFKEALVEYAKAYYPNNYNDFTAASPGTMFIDMASYVGDVLSFYLDNQIQETFLEYAKQPSNLYNLAYMLGYRPKSTSAAVTTLDVYQQLPAITISGSRQPDFNYALVVDEGMEVLSNINTSTLFYAPEKVDFSLSSSLNPTEISVYTVDGSNQPTFYLLKKTTSAISGEVKEATFTFGQAQRFSIQTIESDNIIEIIDAYDSNGNRWYEVPYLAQDYILQPATNTAAEYPNLYQDSNQVPYVAERLEVPRRFISRFKTDTLLELEFGSGINTVSSSAIIPNPADVGIGTIDGISLINTAFDPTNFVTTEDYGLAPSNITITVRYLVGGGAQANVQANQLTVVSQATTNAAGTTSNPTLLAQIKASLAVNNTVPATGGGDGDSVEALRLNTLAQFPSQLRAVTQQDYLARALSMPAKFGQISKAYVTKDDATFRKYNSNEPGERDPLATSLYILAYNSDGQLEVPTTSLKTNLQTYISDYRMLTDAINIKAAFIINIGVNYDIVLRPNYATRDVLATCIIQLKDYFAINKWQINQPIILSEIYTLLDQVAGVQTVKRVEITNLAGASSGYSQYSYDVPGATLAGVVYPSLDPSIFEVKYPNKDIQGRVVTL